MQFVPSTIRGTGTLACDADAEQVPDKESHPRGQGADTYHAESAIGHVAAGEDGNQRAHQEQGNTADDSAGEQRGRSSNQQIGNDGYYSADSESNKGAERCDPRRPQGSGIQPQFFAR